MRLGYTTADMPLSGYLPWLGVAGTGLMLALAGVALAWAIERLGTAEGIRPRLRAAAVPTAVIITIMVLGPVLGMRGAQPAEGKPVVIGMVQGNVDGTAGSHALGYARSVTNNHLSETIMLAAKVQTGQQHMPDFLLWPENSTDVDPTKDTETAQLISEARRFAERPILVGAVMEGPGPDERQTTALWWTTQDAVAARYDKRNLVPFGEYIPMRNTLLPIMPILKQVGRQSVPGHGPGVLNVKLQDGRQLRIGDVICFELAWDSTVHDTVGHDAQLLVVQSNNATYTATAQPRQQFAITRVRAMELRREVVVSTTSSFSGHIDPHGRVIDRTRESTAASASYLVPLRSGRTPALLIGPWLERGASLVALVALGLGLWLPRRPMTAR